MGMTDFLFTSESVTEGHPDKVADQISDAVLDGIIAQDPQARVACETMVTTGMAIIAGEITTKCYVDMPGIVRETIKGIGYTDSAMGFDWENVRSSHRLVSSLPISPRESMRQRAMNKEQETRASCLALPVMKRLN